jgi:hypothetical protein
MPRFGLGGTQCDLNMGKQSSVTLPVTALTAKRMEDVTDADKKSSRTKLTFSKVQG